jgi:heme/copper-type cytochrome/quinol oxidase subunit 2
MISLRSLPLILALFSFAASVPLGLVRVGMDVWGYYHPAVAGAQKVFHDHHGLGMILIGLIFSTVFGLLFWLVRDVHESA